MFTLPCENLCYRSFPANFVRIKTNYSCYKSQIKCNINFFLYISKLYFERLIKAISYSSYIETKNCVLFQQEKLYSIQKIPTFLFCKFLTFFSTTFMHCFNGSSTSITDFFSVFTHAEGIFVYHSQKGYC